MLQTRPEGDYLDQCGSSAANEKMIGLQHIPRIARDYDIYGLLEMWCDRREDSSVISRSLTFRKSERLSSDV